MKPLKLVDILKPILKPLKPFKPILRPIFNAVGHLLPIRIKKGKLRWVHIFGPIKSPVSSQEKPHEGEQGDEIPEEPKP